MQAWLRVIHQRANLQLVRLLPLTLIGRSPECHLRIASVQVSRRHCQIALRADGVYVEDLSSSNGTYLDGTRLRAGTPTYVRSGSLLELGPAKFLVEYDGPAPAQSLLSRDDPTPNTIPMRDPGAEGIADRSVTAPQLAAGIELTVPEPGEWAYAPQGDSAQQSLGDDSTIPLDAPFPRLTDQLPGVSQPASPKRSLFSFLRREPAPRKLSGEPEFPPSFGAGPVDIGPAPTPE